MKLPNSASDHWVVLGWCWLATLWFRCSIYRCKSFSVTFPLPSSAFMDERIYRLWLEMSVQGCFRFLCDWCLRQRSVSKFCDQILESTHRILSSMRIWESELMKIGVPFNQSGMSLFFFLKMSQFWMLTVFGGSLSTRDMQTRDPGHIKLGSDLSLATYKTFILFSSDTKNIFQNGRRTSFNTVR